MKSIQCIVCLSLMLLPAAIHAETIELKYADFEEVGLNEDMISQYLRPLESPSVNLKGIPDPGMGRLWILEARLGTGSNNVFPMVVLLSEDNKTITWTFDANKNNDLSDDQPDTLPFEEDMAEFLPCDFKITVGDAERPYRAHLEFRLNNDSPYCYFRPDCCYTGTITLEGKNYIAALIDSNANGLFNDIEWNTDRLFLWDSEKPYVRGGVDKKGMWMRGSSVRTAILRGVWHMFDPEPDGTAISYLGNADQLVALETGFKMFSIQITSERTGTVDLSSHEGIVMLPPGDYSWNDYSVYIPCKDEKTLSCSSGTIMEEPFTVVAGQKNRLELCVPITQLLSARVKGDTVTFEESFEGRNKEDVRLYYSHSRWAPNFKVSDSEGNVLLNDIFETG